MELDKIINNLKEAVRITNLKVGDSFIPDRIGKSDRVGNSDGIGNLERKYNQEIKYLKLF